MSRIKRLSLVSLVCVILCSSFISVNADINSNLELAKKYEGSFYNYHTTSTWNVISEAGINLGEPIQIDVPVTVSYYVNEEDGYVIQYLQKENGFTYVVWENDTISSLDSSK